MKYILLSTLLFFGLNMYCQIPKASIDEVAFAIVENVPLYEGCDVSMRNDEKRQCMSDKITELVTNNFRGSLGNELGLSKGLQRIQVFFKINEEGIIVDIQARASHPGLEKEAIRVVKLIPKMRPGLQDGKPVSVPYSLPILYNVEGEDVAEEITSYPVYRGCDENSSYEVLKKCTSERIMDFIKVNTTIDIAEKLFPTDNSTQFQANFIIDKKGKIKDIEVKAHKREMAVLVIHAMKQLPKMKAPGTINGTPADVPFSFLMTFYFN